MTDLFDFEDPTILEKRATWLFGKSYRWVRVNERLELHSEPSPPVVIGEWGCCGRPKVL